jgi:IrrE N-terminal-like domain
MSQEELFPEIEDKERALIEQLIAATRLYRTSSAVQELLDFTIRLRRFAPFNALLLHIQKPGLTFAASAYDWFQRFGRVPKVGARPLLVMRTMGPVDFVFDVQDTEGRDLPPSAYSFPTLGTLTEAQLSTITAKITRAGIRLVRFDHGDAKAGWIKRVKLPKSAKDKAIYHLAYNTNHPAPTRLVTLAHELAHLFLGHLGGDGGFKIKDRSTRTKAEREVEAEMVAYIVAKRSGLTPRSESYLTTYQGAFENLDLFAITRAANAVETLMGVAAHQLKVTTHD